MQYNLIIGEWERNQQPNQNALWINAHMDGIQTLENAEQRVCVCVCAFFCSFVDIINCGTRSFTSM